MADCLDGYCRHAGLARQKFMKGQVAQSVEQRIENPCVGGSIPPLATTTEGKHAKTLPLIYLKTLKITPSFGRGLDEKRCAPHACRQDDFNR